MWAVFTARCASICVCVDAWRPFPVNSQCWFLGRHVAVLHWGCTAHPTLRLWHCLLEGRLNPGGFAVLLLSS